MPIWHPVTAGKNDNNEVYQGDWSCGWSPYIYCGIMNWSHGIPYDLFFRFEVTGHLSVRVVYWTGHIVSSFVQYYLVCG